MNEGLGEKSQVGSDPTPATRERTTSAGARDIWGSFFGEEHQELAQNAREEGGAPGKEAQCSSLGIAESRNTASVRESWAGLAWAGQESRVQPRHSSRDLKASWQAEPRQEPKGRAGELPRRPITSAGISKIFPLPAKPWPSLLFVCVCVYFSERFFPCTPGNWLDASSGLLME